MIQNINNLIKQCGMTASIDKCDETKRENVYYVHVVNQRDDVTKNARSQRPDMPKEHNNLVIYR